MSVQKVSVNVGAKKRIRWREREREKQPLGEEIGRKSETVHYMGDGDESIVTAFLSILALIGLPLSLSSLFAQVLFNRYKFHERKRIIFLPKLSFVDLCPTNFLNILIFSPKVLNLFIIYFLDDIPQELILHSFFL